jgi:hypothetical protein
MKHPLFELVTTPDRALRLVAHGIDQYELKIESGLNDWISFSNLSLIWFKDFREDKQLLNLSLWIDQAVNDTSLTNLAVKQGASLTTDPSQADVLITDLDNIEKLESVWTRKLVVQAKEILSIFSKFECDNDLEPPSQEPGPPPALPTDDLRKIWKKIKISNVKSIREGLEELSILLASEPSSVDVLLTEVGLNLSKSSLYAGRRFKRANNELNPHLMYALLGVLSRAPDGTRGSRIKQAVRLIKETLPGLPELKGFMALEYLELDLEGNNSNLDGPDLGTIAEQFNEMPALVTLKLDSREPITTLNGLNAPRLKELNAASLGIKDICGLEQSPNLESVNLNWNQGIVDLRPLIPSVKNLRALKVINTGINSLCALTDSEGLNTLDIDQCRHIKSLYGLKNVAINSDGFSFKELNNLESLDDLPKMGGGRLEISGLPRITELGCIDTQGANLTNIELWNLPELLDISALAKLSKLEHVRIIRCPKLTNVEVLGQLPNLRIVEIRDCNSLAELPSIWPEKLDTITIVNCPIRKLGALPSSLQGVLDLHTCNQLNSLKGMEKCVNLNCVILSPTLKDLSAIKELPDLWIRILHEKIGPDIPDRLVDALAELPVCRIQINEPRSSDGGSGSGYVFNPYYLSRISCIKALDLSDCRIDNLNVVLGLPNLEWLRILPRSELSKKFGGCKFESQSKVAKLQLQALGMM